MYMHFSSMDANFSSQNFLERFRQAIYAPYSGSRPYLASGLHPG